MRTRRTVLMLDSRFLTFLAGGFGGVLFALACQSAAEERAPEPAPPRQHRPTDPANHGPAAAPWGSARGEYPLDPAHSFVLFRTTHAGASYTWGRFLKVQGRMRLGESGTDSSVEVSVESASVFTGVRKRDEHLKGPDFLDAARFPRIVFRSKAITPLEGERVRIQGELTLHGVSKPIEVEGRFVGRGKHPMDPNIELVGFHAEFDIRRSTFGMNQFLGAAGDEVRLFVSLEGARKR